MLRSKSYDRNIHWRMCFRKYASSLLCGAEKSVITQIRLVGLKFDRNMISNHRIEQNLYLLVPGGDASRRLQSINMVRYY
jgi:hypothetical protein